MGTLGAVAASKRSYGTRDDTSSFKLCLFERVAKMMRQSHMTRQKHVGAGYEHTVQS